MLIKIDSLTQLDYSNEAEVLFRIMFSKMIAYMYVDVDLRQRCLQETNGKLCKMVQGCVMSVNRRKLDNC